jgi:hypothetical protein
VVEVAVVVELTQIPANVLVYQEVLVVEVQMELLQVQVYVDKVMQVVVQQDLQFLELVVEVEQMLQVQQEILVQVVQVVQVHLIQ